LLSRRGYGMRGRFGRYSKSETAKCRPVEDLSALNQMSGQERKQGAKPLCSAKPALDHGSKTYHSIIESPGTVKTRVFHFWTSHYTHHRERREREREINRGCMQTTLSFLSRSSQWWVLTNSKHQVLQTGKKKEEFWIFYKAITRFKRCY